MKQFRIAQSAADRQPIEQFQIPTGRQVPVDPKKPSGPTHELVHTFDLYRPSDSAMLMSVNLASRMRVSASQETQRAALGATIDFLGACMDPDQYQTLYELLVDPKFGMDMDEIQALCLWAVETITARPTKRSTGSAPGRSTGGKKSTAAARSKASSR